MNGLQQLAVLVSIVVIVIGILAVRRLVFARMALRSISRRKKHSVIVVCGLLIATAMISGSLVAGDTLDYIITRDIMTSTEEVDVVVSALNETGEAAYFNQSLVLAMRENVSAGALPHIDEVSGAIRETLAVKNMRTGLTFARAGLFGVEVGNTVNPLLGPDGAQVALEDFTDGMTVINSRLADEILAQPGDMILGITEIDPPSPSRCP